MAVQELSLKLYQQLEKTRNSKRNKSTGMFISYVAQEEGDEEEMDEETEAFITRFISTHNRDFQSSDNSIGKQQKTTFNSSNTTAASQSELANQTKHMLLEFATPLLIKQIKQLHELEKSNLEVVKTRNSRIEFRNREQRIAKSLPEQSEQLYDMRRKLDFEELQEIFKIRFEILELKRETQMPQNVKSSFISIDASRGSSLASSLIEQFNS